MIQACPVSLFNNPGRAAEGWYWAFLSAEVRVREAKPIELLGHGLVIYRGQSGRVAAAEAHCPHMGAHLAEGKVDGDGIRCLFHGWRFDRDGHCTHTPGNPGKIAVDPIATRPAEERYGLIWIWLGRGPAGPLPEVPELAGRASACLAGNRFRKNCHPNVVLINAIDEHHFNTVHPMARKLTAGIRFAMDENGAGNIRFANQSTVQAGGWLNRILARLYAGPLTYAMSYWYGSAGTVTLGPDFLHFHILFALRPDAQGRTEGQTVYLTEKPAGWARRLAAPWILRVTRWVGDYFAKGDSEIFRSIRFDFRTPTPADEPILRFVRHFEKQPSFPWGGA